MSNRAPTPENNVILRQMSGMRRDMSEISVTNARVIELLGRMNLRLDEMSERFDRRLRELQGDMVLMENRVVTAITEVRNISARLDDDQADPSLPRGDERTPK
ncbi:hypothetical protein [Methylobacterium sp. GXF4]|uniref:hypothetical protein n=1 Tax=Methylobacterium sp. GXF4 TaxID=1096546 RepID=UPI0002F8544D|nr:hypothetical protein [Methylobacterium sp. GXF4]